MEMPVINECMVEDCSYNRNRACHALAITIGDALRAHCDTFVHTSFKAGDPGATGHVGACKMSDCLHNSELECQAPGIVVGSGQNEADCLTYTPR